MYNFIKGFVGFLLKIFYRIRVEGEITLPEDQSYMICANHIHVVIIL